MKLPRPLNEMPRMVFAGKGALACELLNYLSAIHQVPLTDMPVQYLDDYADGCTKIADYVAGENDEVIVTIASPAGRRDAMGLLIDKGANVLRMGVRTICTSDTPRGIMLPYSLVSCGCAIGSGLLLNTHSAIGHDCVIGNFVTIASHVTICGRVFVGDLVEIGAGATILPGITIGDRAFIGAGSVVVRDVPPDARVAGNPARAIA